MADDLGSPGGELGGAVMPDHRRGEVLPLLARRLEFCLCHLPAPAGVENVFRDVRNAGRKKEQRREERKTTRIRNSWPGPVFIAPVLVKVGYRKPRVRIVETNGFNA